MKFRLKDGVISRILRARGNKSLDLNNVSRSGSVPYGQAVFVRAVFPVGTACSLLFGKTFPEGVSATRQTASFLAAVRAASLHISCRRCAAERRIRWPRDSRKVTGNKRSRRRPSRPRRLYRHCGLRIRRPDRRLSGSVRPRRRAEAGAGIADPARRGRDGGGQRSPPLHEAVSCGMTFPPAGACRARGEIPIPRP